MKNINKFLVATALSILPLLVAAQADAPVAITDFAFLQGYWTGTGFGGVSEETWMPPQHGRMMGMFRQSDSSDLMFSEFMEIVEVDNAFVLRLKHFNPDFSGWEEKAEHVTFKFVSVGKNKAVFGGLTYELIDPDSLQVSLRLRESDGSVHTEVFSFTRNKLD